MVSDHNGMTLSDSFFFASDDTIQFEWDYESFFV